MTLNKEEEIYGSAGVAKKVIKNGKGKRKRQNKKKKIKIKIKTTSTKEPLPILHT